MSIVAKDQKTKRIVFLVLIFVLFSVLVSCIKQINSYFYTNRKLTEREKELQALQIQNQALKAQLEIIKKPGFLAEQARKVFGLAGEAKIASQRPIPTPVSDNKVEEAKKEPGNLQKWWQLFVH